MIIKYTDIAGDEHSVDLLELDKKDLAALLFEKISEDENGIHISYEFSVFNLYYETLEYSSIIAKSEFDRLMEEIATFQEEKEKNENQDKDIPAEMSIPITTTEKKEDNNAAEKDKSEDVNDSIEETGGTGTEKRPSPKAAQKSKSKKVSKKNSK